MHVGHPAAVLANQRGGVHAGQGGVGGVKAEGDVVGIGVLGKVIDVALPEHAGAVVGVEAQGDALLLGVGAHGVGHIAHLVQHLGVGGPLGGAVVAKAGVLAVVPLYAHGGAEVDLLLGDADGLFHVEGEVAVQVYQVHAALLGQVHQGLGVVGVVIADKGEVLHGVIAQELALLEGLLQLVLGGFGLAVGNPGPTGIGAFMGIPPKV